MNKSQVAILAAGLLVIGGFASGYLLGAHEKGRVFDQMDFLLRSERDINANLNLKALRLLRKKEVEKAIDLMQVRIKADLGYAGIEPMTKEMAADYQKEFCPDACLGLR